MGRANERARTIKIIIISIIICCSKHFAYAAETLYHSASKYGPIIVKDDGFERCLAFSNYYELAIKQTCINPNQPKLLAFNYQKIFLGAALLNPKPKSILMIGLGGGTFARALIDIWPDVNLDIVEINPDVYKVALRYFAFNPSRNTKVYIQNAKDFLQSTNTKRYDLIFIDAFGANDVAPELLNDNFISSLRNILTLKGIVLVNTFLRSQYSYLINNLYTKYFDKVNSITDKGNRVVIASCNSLPKLKLSKDEKVFWQDIFKEFNINLNWLSSSYNSAKVLK